MIAFSRNLKVGEKLFGKSNQVGTFGIIKKISKMPDAYSLTISLSSGIMRLVDRMKLGLKQLIGWHPSINSKAHITVVTFPAEPWQLAKLVHLIENYCARHASFEAAFDHFGTYPHGTFFLAPDERSRIILLSILKSFNRKFPRYAVYSSDPHVSIARELDSHSLLYAYALFSRTAPNLSCQINGLTLRKLNKEREQYDTIAHFAFGGDTLPQNDFARQGRLF